MSPRKLFAALAGAALTAGLLVSVAPTAGAGNGTPLLVFVQAQFILDQPIFDLEVENDVCVSDSQGTVPEVPGATVVFSDPNNATVTFPVGTPGGGYEVVVTCTTASGPGQGGDFAAFARVQVDKVVEGDPPPGTEFVVNLDCTAEEGIASGESFGADAEAHAEADGDPVIETDLVFGAAGGSQGVYAYLEQLCTITETDTGGAQAVDVSTEDCGSLIGPNSEATSGDFLILDAVDCTQTVTNTFPAASADDTAAGPVTAAPAFTG